MKKLVTYSLVIFLLSSAGCASVERKFIRKKKIPDHVPAAVYIEQGPYQKKYSNDYYYKTHFTLWKSWQDELLNNLGENQKKVQRCAQEALSQLTEMNRYLIPAKQQELGPNLDSLKEIAAKIDSGQYSKSAEADTRAELEKIRRIVANNFYFDKVKSELVPDRVDLGDANAKTAPAAAPASAPAQ